MIEAKITRASEIKLQRRFSQLAADLKDRRIPNKQISIDLYSFTMRNFQTEGVTVTGARWPELAAGGRWVGSGPNRYFDRSAKLLQDTGQLRNSFVPFSDNDMAGVGAQRMSRSDGAPSDLAEIHQEGLGHMPQREMLPRRQSALEMAVKIYARWVQKVTK